MQLTDANAIKALLDAAVAQQAVLQDQITALQGQVAGKDTSIGSLQVSNSLQAQQILSLMAQLDAAEDLEATLRARILWLEDPVNNPPPDPEEPVDPEDPPPEPPDWPPADPRQYIYDYFMQQAGWAPGNNDINSQAMTNWVNFLAEEELNEWDLQQAIKADIVLWSQPVPPAPDPEVPVPTGPTTGTVPAAKARTNTRWINPATGNDAADGLTKATAWRSLSAKVTSVPANCSVIYVNGSYAMSDFVYSTYGSRPRLAAGVTIKAETYRQVILDGQGIVGNAFDVYDYCRDLEIYGLHLRRFGNNSGNGVFTFTKDCDGFRVVGNVVRDCGNGFPRVNDHTIYTAGGTTWATAPRNFAFIHNDIDGTVQGNGCALLHHYSNSGGHGIHDGEVAYNKVRGTGWASAILIEAGYGGGPANLSIHHNDIQITADNAGDAVVSMYYDRGMGSPNSGLDSSAIFNDNIIVSNGGASGLIRQVRVAGVQHATTWRNNTLWKSPGVLGTFISGIALDSSNLFQPPPGTPVVTPPDTSVALVLSAVNDMKLQNDFTLRGYTTQTDDWYVEGVNGLGTNKNLSGAPAWWKAANPGRYPLECYAAMPWVVLFRKHGSPEVLARVQFTTLFMEAKINGQWTRLTRPQYAAISGYDYTSPDLHSDYIPGSTSSDNTGISTVISPAVGTFHGWRSDPRVALRGLPGAIQGISFAIAARMHPDYLAQVGNIGIQVGGDYYQEVDSTWGFIVPSICTSRTRIVTGAWQLFTASTILGLGHPNPGLTGVTEADFIANPPTFLR